VPGFSVYPENGLVVLALACRSRDILISCDDAERLVEILEACAVAAEKQPQGLYRGEHWGCQVQAYDGRVAIRLAPPEAGNPERVPLPPDTARRLARLVQQEVEWAKIKLRIVLGSRRTI
jgi:hypothetical protein